MSFPLQVVVESVEEGAVTASVRSEAREDKWYHVLLTPYLDIASCTCPHFVNRFVQCKHIGQARYQLENFLTGAAPATPGLTRYADQDKPDLVALLGDTFLSGLELGRRVGRREAQTD